MPETIKLHGVRIHNLKNVSVDVPLNQIVAIAGISGSGKSSLALGASTLRVPSITYSLSPPTPAAV